MDLDREVVRFVNRRILPSHVAKYKFLLHDSCKGGGVISKLENGGSKTSVNDSSCPYKLNDQTSVFFLKNGSAMFEGSGGGDCDDYGGGGGGGGGGNYGSNYGNDNVNNYNYSDSNFYNSNQERDRSEESRTRGLAHVETYSYSDYANTLPLNDRNLHNTAPAESPATVVETQPQPLRDDTQPSPPASSEVVTNPYLEQDLAIHNSEDSPGAEDKIISFDTDCGCPESILASDLLNNRDNENNDGALFHELSALNQIASEKQASSSEAKEESCGMNCLYLTLQCCECTIL